MSNPHHSNVKAVHKVSITEDCYVPGKLLDGTYCKIMLDTVASKLFMSKMFYLPCPLLHSLPKFVSGTKDILVGNGQYIGALFVIPVVINLHRHGLEVHTLILDIHDNMDMAMGIKNVYLIEGVINTRNLCLHFLKRSILIISSYPP